MAGRSRVRRGYVRAESEAAFQQAVINLAIALGWRIYHPPDNRPSRNTGRVQDVKAGFPDLVLVRGAHLIFAELKAEKGVLSGAQQEWLDALGAIEDAIDLYMVDGPIAGDVGRPSVEVFVWRPSDWPEVEKALR